MYRLVCITIVALVASSLLCPDEVEAQLGRRFRGPVYPTTASNGYRLVVVQPQPVYRQSRFARSYGAPYQSTPVRSQPVAAGYNRQFSGGWYVYRRPSNSLGYTRQFAYPRSSQFTRPQPRQPTTTRPADSQVGQYRAAAPQLQPAVPSDAAPTNLAPATVQRLSATYRNPTNAYRDPAQSLPSVYSSEPPTAQESPSRSILNTGGDFTQTSSAATAEDSSLPPQLRLPGDAGQTFAYQVNDESFSLRPGQGVTLSPEQQWKLRFSGGTEQGDRVATLEAGKKYVFDHRGEEGWVLIPDLPHATSKNR